MKNKKILFSLFFLLVAVFEMANLYYLTDLRFISKPMIMITLGVYYYVFSREFDPYFFTALVMALLGDIFLMWEGKIFFLLGLSFFLVMQILYLYVFFKDKGIISAGHWIGIFLIVSVGIMILYTLLPKVESSLLIPVIVYCFSIVIMVCMAWIRQRVFGNYWIILVGSLFFLLSDTVLAFNMFHSSVAYGGLIIMFTYILAQYLLVEGKMRR